MTVKACGSAYGACTFFFFFSNDSFSAKCTSLVSALCSDCSLSFLAKFFTVADPKRKSTSWENAFFFFTHMDHDINFSCTDNLLHHFTFTLPKLHVKLCSGAVL